MSNEIRFSNQKKNPKDKTIVQDLVEQREKKKTLAFKAMQLKTMARFMKCGAKNLKMRLSVLGHTSDI